jgi:hypothetical protein
MQSVNDSRAATNTSAQSSVTPGAGSRVFGSAPSSFPHWKRQWSPRSSRASAGSSDKSVKLWGANDGEVSQSHPHTDEEKPKRLDASAFESTFFKSMFVKQAAAAASGRVVVDGVDLAVADYEPQNSIDFLNASVAASEGSAACDVAGADRSVPVAPTMPVASAVRNGLPATLPQTSFFVGSTFNDFDHARQVSDRTGLLLPRATGMQLNS